MFEHIERVLSLFEEMNVPSYDLLVYHKGKEIYRRLYGYADKEKKVPLTGKELYNIYSCSKVITATAAMSLIEDGKLSLNDPVEKYLPAFRNTLIKEAEGVTPHVPKNRMTIEHLFTMSAGLTYNFDTDNWRDAKKDTSGRCPTVESMNYLAKDTLLFEPGTHYFYSLCHDALAAVTEVVSGELFRDYIKKRIFDRCGMEHSTFHAQDVDEQNIAAQYYYQDGKYIPLEKLCCGYRIGTEYDSGGAGCISSTEDYVRLLESLRTATILKRETIDLMRQNHLSVQALKDYPLVYRGYGYGLGVRCPLAGSEVYDFGWGGAAGAYCATSIEHEYSVYYAQHVLGSPNQQIRNLIIPALELDLGYSRGGKRMEELFEICKEKQNSEGNRLY